MKKIKCQNKVIGSKSGKCGRILGFLTDLQLDILRLDEEKGPVFRCPKCSSEQRWVRIGSNKETGKLTYETLSDEQIEAEEPEYGELIICEQVG